MISILAALPIGLLLNAAAKAEDVHADCALVSRQQAGAILGASVFDADENAMVDGACLFGARALSDDGFVRYSLVRAERLPALRRFFAVNRVLCGNVAQGAPRYAACQTYERLSRAADVADYCTIRSNSSDRTPISGLGDRAFIVPGGAYVLRNDVCVEAVVQRNGAFDAKRTETLVRTVAGRLGY